MAVISSLGPMASSATESGLGLQQSHEFSPVKRALNPTGFMLVIPKILVSVLHFGVILPFLSLLWPTHVTAG